LRKEEIKRIKPKHDAGSLPILRCSFTIYRG